MEQNKKAFQAVRSFYEKDIWRIVFSGVIVVLLVWGTVNTIGNKHYRRLSSQYRTEYEQSGKELSNIREKQRAIETVTLEAVEYAGRNEEYIGQSVETFRELRAQVSLLEDYCYSMRDYIYSIRNYVISE